MEARIVSNFFDEYDTQYCDCCNKKCGGSYLLAISIGSLILKPTVCKSCNEKLEEEMLIG